MLYYNISCILTCIFYFVMYLIILDLKYGYKKSIILMVVGSFFSVGFFLYLIEIGCASVPSSILALTIPSFFFFMFLSKHKDSRYIFTFCSLDILGISTAYFIDVYLPNHIIALILMSLIYSAFIFITTKHMTKYKILQNELTQGWNGLAVISVLFYIMLYLLSGYPTPIRTRPEYTPIVTFFTLIIFVVYIIIVKQIVYMKKVYIFKENEQLLQAQLELKNSQLEVQKLYYKLAHIDGLTGLKNRYSYEQRKKEIMYNWTTYENISCISLDLNDLKITNDTLGHAKGDELILSLSNILKSVFGENGDVYRIGGDEFLAFLCDKSPLEITEIINNLNFLIQDFNSTSELIVSVALGWESLNECACDTLEDLLNKADKKMYENKKQMKCSAFKLHTSSYT